MDLRSLKKLDELGRGAFGIVYLVRDEVTKRKHALKEIKTLPHDIGDYLREIDTLKSADSQRIIKFIGSKTDSNKIYILTEYCEDGCLGKLIEFYKTENLILKEDQIFEWSIQIMEGLYYLHEAKNIVHRDIKPENLFLHRNHVKIGDLGLAIPLDAGSTSFDAAGTPLYLSPEIVKGSGFTFNTDVWSAGCVIYELCTLKPAFKATSLKKLYNQIKEAKVPELETSSFLRAILNLMLIKDKSTRPESREILEKIKRIYQRKKAEAEIIEEILGTSNQQNKITFENGRYILNKKLGNKAFGVVYLVYDTREKIRKSLKIINNSVGSDEARAGLKEAEKLKTLDSPYIIQYYDHFEHNNTFCIVTQYCELGDLSEYIDKYKALNRKFNEKQILKIFCDIAKGLTHIHSNRIIHGNIKPGNIFIDFNKIKIGDLGVARSLESITSSYTQNGTPCYMSPEIVLSNKFSTNTDIWSTACVYYELLTFQKAFDGRHLLEVFEAITNASIPQLNSTSRYSNLLKDMFKRNPEERINSTVLLEKLENIRTQHYTQTRNERAENFDF